MRSPTSLRRTAQAVILAVNKCDNLKREMNIHEFYALGLGDPLPDLGRCAAWARGDLLERWSRRCPSCRSKTKMR